MSTLLLIAELGAPPCMVVSFKGENRAKTQLTSQRECAIE